MCVLWEHRARDGLVAYVANREGKAQREKAGRSQDNRTERDYETPHSRTPKTQPPGARDLSRCCFHSPIIAPTEKSQRGWEPHRMGGQITSK